MARKWQKAPKILFHLMFRWLRGRMGKLRKKNQRRPFDMAVSDYCQGNDRLWKKLYGDQEKPAKWCWDADGAQLPSAPIANT